MEGTLPHLHTLARQGRLLPSPTGVQSWCISGGGLLLRLPQSACLRNLRSSPTGSLCWCLSQKWSMSRLPTSTCTHFSQTLNHHQITRTNLPLLKLLKAPTHGNRYERLTSGLSGPTAFRMLLVVVPPVGNPGNTANVRCPYWDALF